MEPRTFSNHDGNIILEIAEDNYTAYLTINKTDKMISDQEITELIEKADLRYGIEEASAYLRANDYKKEFNQPFPFALGKRPKDPDIEFSLLFKTDNNYNPDMKNSFELLPDLEKVDKDQPIAHLFISRGSKSGIDVHGKEVNPDMTENELMQNYIGENVRYSTERSQLIASVAGYPRVDDLNRVHVKSDFILHTNMDDSYNGFQIFGNLILNGDIKEAVKINIKGDLTVYGNIDDAEIYIQGDLKVVGAILNCKQGITAEGSISFENAENSRIVSGKQISFNRNVHFCRLIAEKGIYGSEEASSLVGGLVQSGENIEVAIIGNAGAMGTEAEIAISPYLKEKMMVLTKQLIKLKENREENVDAIIELSEDLQTLENQLEDEINRALLAEETPKHILVFKKVFPSTYLRILKKSQTIAEEMEKSVFFTLRWANVN